MRHKFINRKTFYAWNALVVSDDNLKIRWLSCDRAGSVHDSRMWNESRLKAMLIESYNPARPLALIGDKGFPCSKVLLTPKKDNQIRSQADIDYNDCLCKPRVLCEHCYGVWKKRFPAILYTLRKDSQEYSQATIFASAVLHNIAIELNEDKPTVPSSIDEGMFNELFAESQENGEFVGEENDTYLRDQIINNFFT